MAKYTHVACSRVQVIKPVAFLLMGVLLLSLAACGGSGSGGGPSTPASTLKGTPEEILGVILEEAAKALTDERPMPAVYTSEVSAETSQNQLGVSSADFTKHVSSASVATALISTFAHEISVIQAKDAASATALKKLIAGEGGYDSKKWICVFPEKSCIIESGAYVLLAVSRADTVDAVVSAFIDAAGAAGDPEVFFTHEGGEAEGGGGMGMGISIGGAMPL
ncbi:MAG: hypothetical protein FWF83_03025 [Clostridiales bacterium]|nr:hypothetical protein [Clostridiales bacterium]